MKTKSNLWRNVHLPLAMLCMSVCCACAQEPEPPGAVQGIDGISIANFPRMDGSTSCRHLNIIIGCKLLNMSCTWLRPLVDEWTVQPDLEPVSKDDREIFWERLKSSQTHGAFMNLIDGNADIILTHRTLSPDERAHAEATGVTLTETPVALDAFVFVVNKKKPVASLTVQQIQDIYTKRITSWKQVGGKDIAIQVFTRPRNSGSEEVFRELVMEGEEPAEFPEAAIGSMAWVFYEVLENEDAICYTFNNYKELIVRKPDSEVPKIAVNGVFPTDETVRNGTYPFIARVYVAIRSDLDKSSMAYRLYEWLQTPDANTAFTESGYIPLADAGQGITRAMDNVIHLYPNPVADGFYVSGLEHPAQLTLYDAAGARVYAGQLTAGGYVNISSLSPGVYFVELQTDRDAVRKKIIKR